jgi:hypothetical protein
LQRKQVRRGHDSEMECRELGGTGEYMEVTDIVEEMDLILLKK